MAMKLVIASISLLCSVVYGANCPDGFESHHDTCYFFSHGKETWIGAYESCHLLGAMLVEVNDQDENMYLSGKAITLGDRWWIGLTDKLVEGEWVWETSMTLLDTDSYSNWEKGEPSNSGSGENCVVYESGSGQWHDTECYHEYHYICEKSK